MLTAVVLVHKRVDTLRLLLNQIDDIRKVADTRLWIVSDRETAAVRRLLRQHVIDHWIRADEPLRSAERGYRYRQLRNRVFLELDEDPSPFVCLFDDDWLWGNGWREHLSLCLEKLARQECTCFVACHLYIWDPGFKTVNLNLWHRTRHLALFQRGWRLPQFLTDYIPVPVDQTMKEEKLPWPILDLGGWTPAERRRAFREAAAAGKIDNWSHNFVLPPNLVSLEVAHERWEEWYQNGSIDNCYLG